MDYLFHMYAPHLPDFPLGAEIVSRIPEDLPGELPATLSEFIRIMHDRIIVRGNT